jgi:threonine aldolase
MIYNLSFLQGIKVSKKKVCLASDNWAPAHSAILEAVVEANQGYTPSYGADLWTEKAQKLIQRVFKSSCKVFIVPSGTGSNVFGLKLACRRYESVICTDIAHIEYQESGASESIIGCKLLTVSHQEGKITSKALLKKLKIERAFGKHSTSPRVLSISQPTEIGTIYTLNELVSLAKLCQKENLLLHIDGSRFYNAIATLQISFSEIIDIVQPDLLSLGGTKNGLIGAEALLIFNKALEEGSDHLHKQTLQLLSKMRYLSAQYIPFFEKNLWHDLAVQANQRAKEIAAIIKTTPHLSLSYPVESNQIFFTTPSSWIPLIQENIDCYLWDQEKNEIRFITSWCTSEEDIRNLEVIFKKISQHLSARNEYF